VGTKTGDFQMANNIYQKKLSKKLSIFEIYRDITRATEHKCEKYVLT